MNENEGQKSAANNNEQIEAEKGPTEKLRDEAKSDAGVSVPAESGVPGAQEPGNEEIKEEKGPNTE